MQRGDFATKICEIATKFSYLIAKCDWIFSLISSPELLNKFYGSVQPTQNDRKRAVPALQGYFFFARKSFVVTCMLKLYIKCEEAVSTMRNFCKDDICPNLWYLHSSYRLWQRSRINVLFTLLYLELTDHFSDVLKKHKITGSAKPCGLRFRLVV